MQWVFGAMATMALVLVLLDMMIDWLRNDETKQEVDELRKRTNIIDEVVTLHSGEIDELQRTRGAQRIQELEAEAGKVCRINTELDNEAELEKRNND